ncbi:MAG: glutamate--tRNA ligase, partial [Alistipes sp.]|nr:glutamate--tRNA ligase [Alistipes sp.]
MKRERPVRVRFAPSPTGPLHIGGVRTALYNYLFARQHGGTMILRIEDTDSQRFVPGAEEYILESLAWCGIEIDEGVGQGGPHAPYRQSERREIYLQYARRLVDAGWAYYAFDTAEELDALRKEYEQRGETFAYNYSVREKLPTSLSLPREEVEARMARGDQWVVRFKMPENEVVEMDDLIRGHVSVNTSTLDDKVLYKSADALPTYHLANIVDDRLMEVSHVIRGEEWLPSLPLHYLLYRAFGWSDVQPEFAHLPLLLKPTGGGKLSKRDGDKMGFPVFPLFWTSPATGETAHGYREDGYLPQAFVNMLALLGWNPGTEQEIFSMEELIGAFSLERVSKSGARFQPEKAKWFNAQYMHRMSDSELAAIYQPVLREHGIEVSDELAGRAAGIMKERATLTTDLWGLTSFFFVAPTEYEEKQTKKYWKGDNPAMLSA